MAHRPGPAPGSGSGSSSRLHFLNSPFGDTTFTKVFVGGLAWETQSETLRRHFEQFGEILEAVVISDKNTGRSKGYGFVTFRDPESARRACADPSPIIDGRRANCNLASLGRPRPAPPYAHVRPLSPYFGGVPVPRGAYIGSSAYQQTFPYNYQQPISYPPYGYTSYGPEYVYPQNIYNPYAGHQYVQVYGVPGAVNTTVYPYGQLGQPLPGGHGYTAVQGYSGPSHHLLQISGPNVNGVTTASLPAIQAPYPADWTESLTSTRRMSIHPSIDRFTEIKPLILQLASLLFIRYIHAILNQFFVTLVVPSAVPGIVAPAPSQPQFIVPAHSPQFTQGSSSDQTAG